jgi:hypothetical protein
MVAMARVEEKLDAVQEGQEEIKGDHKDLTNYCRSLSRRTGALEQFKSKASGVALGLTALGGLSLLTAVVSAFTR